MHQHSTASTEKQLHPRTTKDNKHTFNPAQRSIINTNRKSTTYPDNQRRTRDTQQRNPHRDAQSIAPPHNRPPETANHQRELTNVGIFLINNRTKRYSIVSFILVTNLKMLNKNTRICTLSFKIYVNIFGTIFRSNRYNMKNICTVQSIQYCTLFM